MMAEPQYRYDLWGRVAPGQVSMARASGDRALADTRALLGEGNTGGAFGRYVRGMGETFSNQAAEALGLPQAVEAGQRIGSVARDYGLPFLQQLVGATPAAPARAAAPAPAAAPAAAPNTNDLMAAAMRAESERRAAPATAASAARAAGGTPYGGMGVEQAVASLPPGLNRQQALPLLERMLIRPAPEARRPTGRDVLAYHADALLQQELQALEQARDNGMAQPEFARQRGDVLRRYLSTLGSGQMEDVITQRLQRQ
jgi:hypothetical protein